jgi:hypothetical protein
VTTSLRPVAKRRKLTPGGFQYSYYEGYWNTWPDLRGIKPNKTGITDHNFDLDQLPRKKDYALVVEGFLEATEEGYHIFLLEGDKGTKFYLGNRLLMQWNGGYIRRSNSYIAPLVKGFLSHPDRISA